jgi:hypothetical protein
MTFIRLLWALVSSFLQDRSMVVEVDGVISALRYLSSGVPKRCIPSPLFFSMFINADLQISLSGDRKDLAEMISVLNEDLAAIYRWSAENGLLLNRFFFTKPDLNVR